MGGGLLTHWHLVAWALFKCFSSSLLSSISHLCMLFSTDWICWPRWRKEIQWEIKQENLKLRRSRMWQRREIHFSWQGLNNFLWGCYFVLQKGKCAAKFPLALTSSTKMSGACSASSLIFSPPNAVSLGWHWFLWNVGTISLVLALPGLQHHFGPHTSLCLWSCLLLKSHLIR